MDERNHWEQIYRTKASNAVSWYRPHLEKSLALIARAAVDLSASIIDVGGGESTLVDDLLAHGYTDVSVLDISQMAVDVARQRLGNNAARVRWWVADITQVRLNNLGPRCKLSRISCCTPSPPNQRAHRSHSRRMP